MRSLFLAIVATALLTVGCAHAQSEPSEIIGFELTAPVGFSGPQHIAPGPGAESYAYSKDRAIGQVRTLLQVTSYDFGKSLKDLPHSDHYPAARKYLLDFLKGIERKRLNYSQSEPAPASLDGESAARAEWSGQVDGTEAHGVMYAVIVGTTLYVFHAQDSVAAPTSDMQDAIHAIESVRFKRIG